MKKKLIGLALGAIGLMLVACGSDGKEVEVVDIGAASNESGSQTSGISDEDVTQGSADDTGVQDSEEEIYVGMNMANPWVDSDRAGVASATGFDLVAPEGAANVVYSCMPDEGMAQLNYNQDNTMWVYRVQHTDALEDISGIYCDWDYVGEAEVAGMAAMEYSYANEVEEDGEAYSDCVRVINWYDAGNKVTHSLSALSPDLNGMDIVTNAENIFNMSSYVAGTPESDGIASVSDEVANGYKDSDLYQSYLGLHVCGDDGSDIMVEEDGNDHLKVNVSIFRLCTLDDGEGIYENGVVIFNVKDPNGEPMRCCLYYNADNSLCLEIQESTWEYLPNGTVIEGFDN